MRNKSKTNVLFIHVKTSMLDGVSLEIEKRAEIFRKHNANVFYITGIDGLKRKEAIVIPELAREHPLTEFLVETLFQTQLFPEKVMYTLYKQLEYELIKKIKKAIEKVQPDLIFVHNLFSHGVNPLATTALIKVLDSIRIPTIAVNHDFWFERKLYEKPRYEFLHMILDDLPYDRGYIWKNQVINSIAGDEVMQRKGLETEKIGDYFDFSAAKPKIDSYNKDLPQKLKIDKDDLVILHATRIVERKAIENAVRFSAKLAEHIAQKITLLFPNYTENDTRYYQKELDRLAQKLNVNAVWAEKHFAAKRHGSGSKKKYSFWDAYLFADLVTYTSIWEGFGNQFLEAIYFEKPIVLFEYPVFKKDLKKEGYDYISLGSTTKKNGVFNYVPDRTIARAAKQTKKLLSNKKKVKESTQKNLKTASRFHGDHLLVDYIRQLLEDVKRR